MKRIMILGAAGLIASWAFAAPALAQAGFGFGPGFQMMGPGVGYGPGMMMGRGRHMMIDANDDGLVSAEEAASAADEVFTAMDSDDDGALTQDEYLAVRMGPSSASTPTDRPPARRPRKSASPQWMATPTAR